MKIRAWWLVILICCGVSQAEARNFRVSQVPSGGQFGCGLCHEGGRSGAPRNAFGLQVEETLGNQDIEGANVVWGLLVNLDADGDGVSNGEELGDPDGTWRIGDSQPQRSVSDPNNPDSTPDPCGNGVLDQGEDCDRVLALAQGCGDLGFVGGTLGCNIDCTFDTSACSNCGNGVLDRGEVCDGEQLGENTCLSQGFGRGVLSCTNNCQLDTSLCSNCGNNVRDGLEACDGDDLDGQTCWTQGYQGGSLSCDEACGFDTAACEGDPSWLCGNSAQEGDEACDGDDLAGQSCQSLGFGGGDLGCRVDCTLDTSLCTPCGNGALDEGEDCDGDNLGGASCLAQGFDGGTLGCDEACGFDTSACFLEEDMGSPDMADADMGPPDSGPHDMGSPDTRDADEDLPEDLPVDMATEDSGQPDVPEEDARQEDVPQQVDDMSAQGDSDQPEEETPAPSAGGDEGCAAAPGQPGSAPGGILLLLGLWWLGRRR